MRAEQHKTWIAGCALVAALAVQARSVDASSPPTHASQDGSVAPSDAIQDGAPAPAEPSGPPTPWEPRYRELADARAWAEAWIATGAATRVELPASRGGLAVPALEFGADGPLPVRERPTIFLLGGLDGTSLAGAEGALRAADELLRVRADLPPGVAFVAVPWASPDALARPEASEGRDLEPFDDDGDLVRDEDPPDDLDGDGRVLEMYVEHPQGTWARPDGARAFVLAGPADSVRYVRALEGKDDDGDGRFNEDPLGGSVLDLCFPVGWNGEPGSVGGLLPLDDPLSRALADLALARPPLAFLCFQGNHGLAAYPGGVSGLAWSDAPPGAAYQRAVELWERATGRTQPGPVALRRARGEPRPGAAIDWVHAVVGALALEVAPWGPRVQRSGDGRGAVEAGWPDANGGTRGAEAARAELEREWERWLDDVRGGIGFVEWHRVELAGGRGALVGGWLPLARANPPQECLADATKGLGDFVRALAGAAPRLELVVLQADRDGEVVTVRAQLANRGSLPTGLARSQAAQARVEIELPAGARLLWGETDARLGVLGPGETSREITAVALAPAGAAIVIRARGPWSAPVELEVRR